MSDSPKEPNKQDLSEQESKVKAEEFLPQNAFQVAILQGDCRSASALSFADLPPPNKLSFFD